VEPDKGVAQNSWQNQNSKKTTKFCFVCNGRGAILELVQVIIMALKWQRGGRKKKKSPVPPQKALSKNARPEPSPPLRSSRGPRKKNFKFPRNGQNKAKMCVGLLAPPPPKNPKPLRGPGEGGGGGLRAPPQLCVLNPFFWDVRIQRAK